MTSGARILVVDDHASVREAVRNFLENVMPFTVCGEADNGTTAIQMARRLQPDVIVLDLALPRMNGVEVATVLRSDLPHVKIVAFSMYVEELGKAVASAAHINAMLPKAAGLRALAETIRRLLDVQLPTYPPSGSCPETRPE